MKRYPRQVGADRGLSGMGEVFARSPAIGDGLWRISRGTFSRRAARARARWAIFPSAERDAASVHVDQSAGAG